MDQLELRSQFASRMVKSIRLEDYGMDLYIRKFTGSERSKFSEQCKIADKSREADNSIEVLTNTVQAFVIVHGLCDEKGNRTFKDSDQNTLAEIFPSDALDEIAEKILVFSKLKKADDEIKNSEPVQSESSS